MRPLYILACVLALGCVGPGLPLSYTVEPPPAVDSAEVLRRELSRALDSLDSLDSLARRCQPWPVCYDPKPPRFP